ncbi:MAG: hypothetical protein KUG68_08825 [Flavobacteriaceae bacterium]|nr:hypothetical protein [Flavobacteriaceae bacterium]
MKKLILLLAVALVVFSCSKDNINTETETTADLTQTTSNKSLDETSEVEFYGVFGHNANRELHGKINIFKSSKGVYSAQINLVNGDILTFLGNGLNNEKLHFVGDRGSFDFDISDNNSKATNVFIDQETEGYIETRRGVGIVILGAYEQTGNEANFYGNWDLLATEVPTTAANDNNQRGGGGGATVDAVIVSHKGNRGPFIDTSFENHLYCIGDLPPQIYNLPGDGSWYDIWCDGQISMLAGFPSNWNLKVIPGFHNDFVNYFGPLGDCIPAPNGTWSWAGRTGTITLLSHIPVPPPISNDDQTRVVADHYADFR